MTKCVIEEIVDHTADHQPISVYAAGFGSLVQDEGNALGYCARTSCLHSFAQEDTKIQLFRIGRLVQILRLRIGEETFGHAFEGSRLLQCYGDIALDLVWGPGNPITDPLQVATNRRERGTQVVGCSRNEQPPLLLDLRLFGDELTQPNPMYNCARNWTR